MWTFKQLLLEGGKFFILGPESKRDACPLDFLDCMWQGLRSHLVLSFLFPSVFFLLFVLFVCLLHTGVATCICWARFNFFLLAYPKNDSFYQSCCMVHAPLFFQKKKKSNSRLSGKTRKDRLESTDLLRWSIVCMAKKSGRLGIRKLSTLNDYLLGKWS